MRLHASVYAIFRFSGSGMDCGLINDDVTVASVQETAKQYLTNDFLAFLLRDCLAGWVSIMHSELFLAKGLEFLLLIIDSCRNLVSRGQTLDGKVRTIIHSSSSWCISTGYF